MLVMLFKMHFEEIHRFLNGRKTDTADELGLTQYLHLGWRKPSH